MHARWPANCWWVEGLCAHCQLAMAAAAALTLVTWLLVRVPRSTGGTKNTASLPPKCTHTHRCTAPEGPAMLRNTLRASVPTHCTGSQRPATGLQQRGDRLAAGRKPRPQVGQAGHDRVFPRPSTPSTRAPATQQLHQHVPSPSNHGIHTLRGFGEQNRQLGSPASTNANVCSLVSGHGSMGGLVVHAHTRGYKKNHRRHHKPPHTYGARLGAASNPGTCRMQCCAVPLLRASMQSCDMHAELPSAQALRRAITGGGPGPLRAPKPLTSNGPAQLYPVQHSLCPARVCFDTWSLVQGNTLGLLAMSSW